MYPGALSAEQHRWLQDQLQRGCTPDSIVQALAMVGHPRADARRAVEAAIADAADPSAPRLVFELISPGVRLLDDVLSPEACRALIEASRPRLTASTVVDPVTGAHTPHPERISDGASFERGETPLIARLEQRVEAIFGYPIDHQEPLQILRYGVGGEYRPHHDYFDAGSPGYLPALKVGGQRVATVIFYLNDVLSGGGTLFPNLKLIAHGKPGRALAFANVDDNGQVIPDSLHGGEPVRAGEKWIATKWVRAERYGG
jgi:prolyl 4-hydroxylase